MTVPMAWSSLICPAAIDAAYCHAIEAVRLWVEDAFEDGEKLPRPRSLMELAADREVRRALAAGAALIMVPVVIKVGRPKKKRRRYSLEQLLARLIGDWRCACF